MKLAVALILALTVGSYAFAQSGLTIDQVEAQVVALQTLTSPTPTGVTQPPTLADQIIALQTLTTPSPAGSTNPPTLADQLASMQNTTACISKNYDLTSSNFNVIFGGTPIPPVGTPSLGTLNSQLQTQGLQLSTVGVLNQLGLDNQANIATLQQQVALLQQQVAALTPIGSHLSAPHPNPFPASHK